MKSYKILFFGDVVGRAGRKALVEHIESLKESFGALFVIVNAENSANGSGINPKIADELFNHSVDAITLGNHAFRKKEILPYFQSQPRLIRPGNMPKSTPGKGLVTIEKEGISLTVINLCGRVFMDLWGDPFELVDDYLKSCSGSHIFIDFHAEATSEKLAFGRYLDGRAVAVVGTHTHVTTADEQIFKKGTAYITDVGMCGPCEGILGVDAEKAMYRFVTTLKQPFESANGDVELNGVMIEVDASTGKALHIERIRRRLRD